MKLLSIQGEFEQGFGGGMPFHTNLLGLEERHYVYD